ncbi:hypothetical protein E2C01_057952 [Portunus trituberculatus]|uniref:Uncharacterized protein n=1 Tax=Portunus trituberculatus TaxID=210409 RepID=A0A5B7H1W5_PORTR|nr:hypothetical protein [Portunus trituberculatus]
MGRKSRRQKGGDKAVKTREEREKAAEAQTCEDGIKHDTQGYGEEEIKTQLLVRNKLLADLTEEENCEEVVQEASNNVLLPKSVIMVYKVRK